MIPRLLKVIKKLLIFDLIFQGVQVKLTDKGNFMKPLNRVPVEVSSPLIFILFYVSAVIELSPE